MANNFCQCALFETCATCNPEQTTLSNEILQKMVEEICSPPQPKITVMGGTELTLDEAKLALEEAMKVIECVGTTGIYRQYERAEKWMKKYFPNWA